MSSLAAIAIVCSQCRSKDDSAKEKQAGDIHDLVRDEEAVLEVTTLTKKLGASIKSKRIISPESRVLFADKLIVTDLLDPAPLDELVDVSIGITREKWNISAPKELTLAEIEKTGLWSALFDSLYSVSNASFGFISGTSEDGKILHSILKFGAKGIDHANKQVSLKGKLAVDWEKTEDSWRIVQWKTKSMTVMRGETLMFRNHMSDLFRSSGAKPGAPSGYELATRSFHEEKLVEFIKTNETRLPKTEYGSYFKLESDYQHPSVSVIDINNDGWDDLFVTSLWAPCQLWVNQGGEHFIDKAEDYGLDVLACCTSAIFADFDNDGDADLLLGRSLERSQLFWNEGGYFKDSKVELPYLVTSVSAADCNNDGLLDIYLCTYGPNGSAAQKNPAWINRFLPPDTHAAMHSALAKGHRYFDQAGPRNLLLINRGERKFEPAPANADIDQYHNSYQGSWADYDKDGDLDLYVCNDFAPDSLLRNNGWDESGIPSFTDVSEAISNDNMKGFGMGASWGDYDNDQQPDLFVSNMYSKAGHRVLSRFEDVDNRLHFSARGNLLFNQRDGKFQQLAGESKEFPVDQGSWAFGGQFIDVDNDAWLDIYVPNGFYTAPKSVASEVDL